MTMRKRSTEELLEKVYSGHWRAREFRVFQQRFGDDALFALLVHPFSGQDLRADDFVIQERIGDLLLTLAPKCPADLRDLLRSTLRRWNASVEQFPYYLLDQFGPDSFRVAVEDVFKEVQHDPELVRQIESLRYWMKGWLQH